jgi:cob(I)alamin adenosyltransferase
MTKSKIYTRSGDDGLTSLVGGRRTHKHSDRVEAYGAVDELNAFISCLMEEISSADDADFLTTVQSELFTLGCYLASDPGVLPCEIDEAAVDRIETEIDRIDLTLPPIKHFLLPGGCRASAMANVCRTVCRRAERSVYQLHSGEKVEACALRYINRLSDYFFVLGRKYNLLNDINEKIWKKPDK